MSKSVISIHICNAVYGATRTPVSSNRALNSDVFNFVYIPDDAVQYVTDAVLSVIEVCCGI